MIRTNLLESTNAREVTAKKGSFCVLEYKRDLSVTPEFAAEAYFSSQMNIRKKQLVAELEGNGVIVQSGAMQFMAGKIQAATNIKGVVDLTKKFVGGKMTGETVIKPRYAGTGQLILEPTFRYILLEDLAEWHGGMCVENGMFLACEDTVQLKVQGRNSVSSLMFGKEGLFNLALKGQGVAALESPVPREELIVIDLEDDVLKVDGNMAIAWSSDLKFTVEKTTKTLTGSAASGEGLVNTFRGTGRVLLAPVDKNQGISAPEREDQEPMPEEEE